MSSISSSTSSAGLFYGPASPLQGPGQGIWTAEGHGLAPAHGAAAARPDWQSRQALLGQAQAQLDSLPPGAQREQLQSDLNRYRDETMALEHARLAANVYTLETPPVGWTNVSNDRARLAELGLTPEQLQIPGTSFRAQVYAPDPEVLGSDMKVTVVFQGTTGTWADWKNNLFQGLNIESPYYRQAVDIGNTLYRSGVDVHLVGHSLGGGLASAAAHASGLPATTFNAAGLHKKTVERYGGLSDVPPESVPIKAWYVDGEILDAAQHQSAKRTAGSFAAGTSAGGPKVGLLAAAGKVLLAEAMPDVVGERMALTGGTKGPIDSHKMDEVQALLVERLRGSEHVLREQLRWP
ncbi:MAG: DUF2974 domain-containing protein [Comamonadaceae bacterium]|nr:DUF2974 domain-containing protein [Comamonadaceae bacterium]